MRPASASVVTHQKLQRSQRSSIDLHLQGNLESAKFGAVTLSSIRMGDASILEQLPKWPKIEIEQGEEFDFPMFMKMVSVLGALAQK